MQDLYRDISRLIQLAHPGEGDELVKYVGVESFINALDDRYLRLEVLKLRPADLEASGWKRLWIRWTGRPQIPMIRVADVLLPAPALCSQWLVISLIRTVTLTS